MRRYAIAFTFALAAALIPAAVQAQSKGPYVSGAFGVAIPEEWDMTGTGVNTTLESESGPAFSAAAGTTFGTNWRAEVEMSYRSTDVESLSGAGAQGETSMMGLMVNGYYDFDIGSRLTPYLGGGLGGAILSYDDVGPVNGSRIGDDDRVFAYQGIAGLNYKIDEALGLFTEYRYVGTSDPAFRTDGGTGLESESGEHRIMVGLRWSFGAPKPVPKPEPVPVQAPAPEPKAEPKPAPKPAPEPEVARNYLVFFDWDRSVLTGDAKAIIAQAVKNSRKISVTRLRLTGHADRSGPDPYNMGLSQRRAQSVQTELLRLGIPADQISLRWKGEREPLVPTPDGVREPQNRRVEIVME